MEQEHHCHHHDGHVAAPPVDPETVAGLREIEGLAIRMRTLLRETQ